MKKIEILFKIKSMDGGRISLQTRIRQVCAGEKVVLEQRWGHIPKINSQKYGL